MTSFACRRHAVGVVVTGLLLVLLGDAWAWRSLAPVPVVVRTAASWQLPVLGPLPVVQLPRIARKAPPAPRKPVVVPPRAAVRTPHPVALLARPVVLEVVSDEGYDVSWPQCPATAALAVLPRTGLGFATVGITRGHPLSVNPCLKAQVAWAVKQHTYGAYLNLASPPSGALAPAAYGVATVRAAMGQARAAGLKAGGVWLDVETGNSWSKDTRVNAALITAAMEELQREGLQPGVYTTPRSWRLIAGGLPLKVPLWQPVFTPTLAQGCGGAGIAGRRPDVVQQVAVVAGLHLDHNHVCRHTADVQRLLSLDPATSEAPLNAVRRR